ncbi:DNA methyltransferase [Lactococcus lactis RTB018]|uniref:Cytosine-specific methyltransferase n=1 Tax=Lactococcus lactis subsp. lactis TaxID=1360 RepID=A0A1V0NFY5_LACLL|nr:MULTISPECIES: DNA cytosine methyltransferase [Lactococcus]ARD98854.1 Modification methylase ScrFIA [Lactococcus lactis subsp. lactis]NHI69387.1 DNA cytosine methyltransferase [Lactococcus garvieae]NHJ06458.1 DNA cytosine methyltransferase [Lactococcus garvieae]OAZ17112.1 DNA methyltransferase [Lactococcus lactis RTB018]
MKKLNNIELFAGAGGLLDGFEQTGNYTLLAAVEWLKPQVRTLINRLQTKYNDKEASKKILNFDIQRTDELINGWRDDIDFGSSEGLKKLVNDRTVDVISGGPPCQAYSLAGRIRDSNGMKDDYRNFLFEAYIRVVQQFRPKIVVFENVEGILSAIPSGEKIVDLIKGAFDAEGYEIVDDLRKYALLNLTEFGVPQKRKRVIIIGVRRDNSNTNYQKLLHDFYEQDLAKLKVSKVQTVRMAIGDLPPIYPLAIQKAREAYTNDSGINGHISRFHSLRDQSIFYTLAKDIESGTRKYNTTESLKDLYYKTTGKKTNVHKYHVLRWDEPSNTIPAHLKKDGLRHIHPDPKQKRTITVREAARLQTFSDDFEFNESQLSNFEMIGNAVPPLFAYKLGKIIPELIEKIQALENQ